MLISTKIQIEHNTITELTSEEENTKINKVAINSGSN